MIPNRLREIDWALGLLAEARRNPKDKSVIHGNGLSLGAGKVLKERAPRGAPFPMSLMTAAVYIMPPMPPMSGMPPPAPAPFGSGLSASDIATPTSPPQIEEASCHASVCGMRHLRQTPNPTTETMDCPSTEQR
jgi:hypothetical protein